jgi:hypothetical protein
MRAIGAVAILAALLADVAFPSSAYALTVGQFYEMNAGAGPTISSVNFFSGPKVTFGSPSRLDRLDAQTVSAAERYYDFDTIITLGTLVIAGGALTAIGFSASRRKEEERDKESETSSDWRDVVLRTLEDDLTHYARGLRHVA